MKLFFIALVLFFFNSTLSPVFAETVIWNPDPLPSKFVGESLTINSVTILDPQPNAKYYLTPGGSDNFRIADASGNQFSFDSFSIPSPLSSKDITVRVTKLFPSQPPIATVSSRTFSFKDNPNLPDLRPLDFGVCYQPNPSDQSKVRFNIFISDENLGPSVSGPHDDYVYIDNECATIPLISFPIPALNSGQHFATTRTYDSNSITLACIQNSSYRGARFFVNQRNDKYVFERDINNNAIYRNSINSCVQQPVICSAGFNPTSGTVISGNYYNLQGKIESVSGGDGTGYDFRWTRKFNPGNYVYPPTVNPTQIGVWYPGRWDSTGFNVNASVLLTFEAKNKSQSWESAVKCSGETKVTVK